MKKASNRFSSSSFFFLFSVSFFLRKARKKFLAMIKHHNSLDEAHERKKTVIALMMGSVDCDFVHYYKQEEDNEHTFQKQITQSINGMRSFVKEIENKEHVIIFGIHPPTVNDDNVLLLLNKTFFGKVEKMEERVNVTKAVPSQQVFAFVSSDFFFFFLFRKELG